LQPTSLPILASPVRTESLMSSTTVEPSIVFAQGLWADGPCFQELVGAPRAKAFDIENQMVRVDLYCKGEWS
jgi:hypothetical protein